MSSIRRLLFALPLVLGCSGGALRADLMFSTNFDGSTGHHVFAAGTDNTSGSSSLGVSWTTDPSVTGITGLTALSTGDSGTLGGFAVTQNGSAFYANADVVYLSRNMNLDTDRTTTRRGFSLQFTLNAPWTLNQLTVVAEHTTNTGTQNQAYTSDLYYQITGPTPLSGMQTVDYNTAGDWHTTVFSDLAGATLPSGTHTLTVYMSNMTGGGAYASYDGLSLEGVLVPEPGTLALGLLGAALLIGGTRHRRG